MTTPAVSETTTGSDASRIYNYLKESTNAHTSLELSKILHIRKEIVMRRMHDMRNIYSKPRVKIVAQVRVGTKDVFVYRAV